MSIFCRHLFRWVRNIYGDEINATGGRSWWQCRKCGKWSVGASLVKDSPA